MDSHAQHRRSVTSSESRAAFYAIAIIVLFGIIGESIEVLLLESHTYQGMLPKLLCVILLGATIPYVGSLVSCMRKDVPVPSYRLGAERRLGIYLCTMISTFCISYNSLESNFMLELSFMAILVITGVMAILQLHSPAEDFDVEVTTSLVPIGFMSAMLGLMAHKSWMSLFGSLFILVAGMCLIQSHCVTTNRRLEQQQRDRGHLHRPILSV